MHHCSKGELTDLIIGMARPRETKDGQFLKGGLAGQGVVLRSKACIFSLLTISVTQVSKLTYPFL